MSPKREGIRILCQTNPDEVIALIEQQEARIKQQEARIAHLEARIAELEARLNQNSRNSSRPPSTDTYTRPQSQRKKGERPPGGQKGHKGQTLAKVDEPDEIIFHTVPVCEEA